jgi:uncharacterized protein YjeT (DUF2065 family)
MDLIGFLNDITGGNLLLWKVIAATVVFCLAGLQVLLAARFWDKTVSEDRKAGFERLHRINGRVTLVLAVIVAISCLAGPAGPSSPARVLYHSIFGTVLFAVLAAKFAILRVLHKGYGALPFLGTALFLLFGGLWATSVFDYVTRYRS